MKRAMFLLCAAMAWCTAQAQRPALRFDAEGRFKIVQFTDVHLDLSTPYRQGEAVKTLAQLRDVLAAERPDLAVFTGDVVTGPPAAEGWRRVLDAVEECGVPFCVVLGNHDAEQDLTRGQIARIVCGRASSLNTLSLIHI